jgi:hypothetical protein
MFSALIISSNKLVFIDTFYITSEKGDFSLCSLEIKYEI